MMSITSLSLTSLYNPFILGWRLETLTVWMFGLWCWWWWGWCCVFSPYLPLQTFTWFTKSAGVAAPVAAPVVPLPPLPRAKCTPGQAKWNGCFRTFGWWDFTAFDCFRWSHTSSESAQLRSSRFGNLWMHSFQRSWELFGFDIHQRPIICRKSELSKGYELQPGSNILASPRKTKI